MLAMATHAQNLVISEIMYNPPESGTDSLEYIEIYNNGSAAVNMNGYTMDGVTYTFSSVSVNAGDYLVIAVDSMAMYNVYGISAYQWTSGGLSNSGETLRILDNNGATVDSVTFDDSAPWPTDADGNGYSLNLCDPNSDNTLGTSWSLSGTMVAGMIINSNQLYGSPGSADAGCSTVSPGNPNYPLYTISQVTTNDVNGNADSLNVMCQLNATIYSIDFDGNSGYSFFMHDATGGINVYSSSDKNSYTSPMPGDSVSVYGSIDQYNGLTEMAVDSIVLRSSGNSIGLPMAATTVDESTEGEYIRLNGYHLATPTQWPALGSSANVDITNGTDTVVMRIDSDTDIDGTIAPTGTFDVLGAGGQYDASAPYDAGYQLMPSSITDFITSSTSVPGYPAYSISQVTTNDINGVADSNGVQCALTGTIFSIDFDGNAGYSFFMKDATGGINVFNYSDVNGYTSPMTGDNITVYGAISQYNGLTEMGVDSIVLNSVAGSLGSPAVVSTLDESTESEYIRMNGYYVATPSQWPSAGSSASVDITNGTDTVVMRIDSDTDIDGSPVPTGTFDVIGAGSQYDSSSPYDEGYQIQPSSLADIVLPIITTPTANFALTSQTVAETAGTITVNILVNPTASTAETIDLQTVQGVNFTSGDATITPAPTSGMFQLAVPANTDTVSFDINVIDDAIMEGNETLYVNMSSVSSGLLLGANASYSLIIQANDRPIPTRDIADITTTDSQGVPDSLGLDFKINGIVFTDDFQGGASGAGLSFYMYDNTGSINVFNFSNISGYAVTRGDSIRAIGSVDNYNGLVELNVDSIVVLSTGHTIKAPTVVTSLGESTESELIRMNGYHLATPSQWPVTAGGSVNIDITNGTDTVVMRIDSDVDLNGSPAPVGNFDVIGVGGQFDPTIPYTSGYQIMPRDQADIIVNLPSLAITEIMASSNDPASSSNGDWFEVTNTGSAAIDMNGFSWDDDSRTPGTHTIDGTLMIGAGESIIFLDEVQPDDSTWAYEWMQYANNLQVIAADEFNAMGFSGLGSGGDEVNLYDDNGALIQRVTYASTDVTAGYSMQIDSMGTITTSVVGVNGVYTSIDGDVGNPGNMNPVSLQEFAMGNLSLYPNPATDALYIQTEDYSQKMVTITSVTGQQVTHFTTNDKLIKVNTSDLKAGVYIFTLTVHGESYANKVIVK